MTDNFEKNQQTLRASEKNTNILQNNENTLNNEQRLNILNLQQCERVQVF